MKKKYIKPTMELIFLEIEDHIATASIRVENQAQQEWEIENDDNRTFNWDSSL